MGTRRSAFTLVELMVVISIVLVLMAILVPTLSGARERARRAVCSSNLHNAGIAFTNYANEHEDRLPMGTTYGGNWLWDISRKNRDVMVYFGMARESFYCPSGGFQNNEELWNYDPNFTVTGYFWFLKRPDGPMAPQTLFEKQWVIRIGTAADSTTELGADACISQTGVFNAVYGGWPNPHRTSHMQGDNDAAGGNILFLDTHVEWRPFEEMKIRLSSPDQWW